MIIRERRKYTSYILVAVSDGSKRYGISAIIIVINCNVVWTYARLQFFDVLLTKHHQNINRFESEYIIHFTEGCIIEMLGNNQERCICNF